MPRCTKCCATCRRDLGLRLDRIEELLQTLVDPVKKMGTHVNRVEAVIDSELPKFLHVRAPSPRSALGFVGQAVVRAVQSIEYGVDRQEDAGEGRSTRAPEAAAGAGRDESGEAGGD